MTHAVEQATRLAYRQAATAALSVIDELGEGVRENVASPPWPTPPDVSAHFVPTILTEHADAASARLRGWLVTGRPPTPRTPVRSVPAGPLVGMRMAVKDVIDVAELPTCNGTEGGAWRHPRQSAPSWEALERAGAECLGKTATHEMAWGVTTPQIANPVDATRIAGGSSGGSAAVVAAGVADAALGTDTGGSIRIPAALCGVVGMRTTLGSMSSEGVTPLAPSQDTVGPLASDVATCGAVLEILLGRPLAGPTARGMRVGIPEHLGALDDSVATSWAAARALLETEGVELVPLATLPLRAAGAVSLLTMLLESAEHHAAAVSKSPDGFGAEARALLTLGSELVDHRAAVARARSGLVRASADVFADHGVQAVVTPTTAMVAPLRGATSVELSGRRVAVPVGLTRFAAWASAAGLPALSVPAPSTGLPVGLQVMAPPNGEATCLALALAVEGAVARR